MAAVTATVRVESIAAGGDGVARAEGFVVFVPRSAPGDLGAVDVAKRGSFTRSPFIRLIEESPLRIDPLCPHYVTDKCGGCQLQHLRYDAQLDAKAGIIRDSIQRIGKRGVDAPAVEASPQEWRYRRKLTLAMSRTGDRWIAGLHPYDAPRRIFAMRDCPITDERVLELWQQVMSAQHSFPLATALRGAVRIDGGGATFVMEGGEVWPTATRFFDSIPSLTALWWIPDKKRRRLMQERGGQSAPGASFVQVNAPVAAQLHAHVRSSVLARGPEHVVDGYSGSGDLALSLAESGVRVTAIELDADAAAFAAARLPAGSRALPGTMEDLLPAALPADVVVLNPPRAGIDGRVAEILEQCDPAPQAVVYVSCNPATLARDLSRMPRYRIESLRAFDMFPQTAHVETVCELVPVAT